MTDSRQQRFAKMFICNRKGQLSHAAAGQKITMTSQKRAAGDPDGLVKPRGVTVLNLTFFRPFIPIILCTLCLGC